jgi:hypothetical protein
VILPKTIPGCRPTESSPATRRFGLNPPVSHNPLVESALPFPPATPPAGLEAASVFWTPLCASRKANMPVGQRELHFQLSFERSKRPENAGKYAEKTSTGVAATTSPGKDTPLKSVSHQETATRLVAGWPAAAVEVVATARTIGSGTSWRQPEQPTKTATTLLLGSYDMLLRVTWLSWGELSEALCSSPPEP